jgi:hypothetical protein
MLAGAGIRTRITAGLLPTTVVTPASDGGAAAEGPGAVAVATSPSSTSARRPAFPGAYRQSPSLLSEPSRYRPVPGRTWCTAGSGVKTRLMVQAFPGYAPRT